MTESSTHGSSRTTSRPISQKSTRSTRSDKSRPSSKTSNEETPLLSRDSRYLDDDERHHSDDEDLTQSQAETSLLRSLQAPRPRRFTRWPSLAALLLLLVTIVLIMLFRFFVPEAVTEYARQAVDLDLKNLSLESFTDTGFRVRIVGDVKLVASKVTKAPTRRIGRIATWFAKSVESGQTDISIILRDYDNALAVLVDVPAFKVDVRNEHVNHLDLVVEVQPKSFDTLRVLAGDWLHDTLPRSLLLSGKAVVPVRLGIINLGAQALTHDIYIDHSLLPKPPSRNEHFNISKIAIHSKLGQGLNADATVTIPYDNLIAVNLPPVGFDVLVGGCDTNEYIQIASGSSGRVDVKPYKDIQLAATAHIDRISNELTKPCKEGKNSPLDRLTYDFARGLDTTVYGKCCNFPDTGSPQWLRELTRNSVLTSFPLPGKQAGALLRSFSLTNTSFSLPSPLADPDTPDGQPRVSSEIEAIVALPEEMDFPLTVRKLRPDATIFHQSKTLGKLDLSKWQKAKSMKLAERVNSTVLLQIKSFVEEAPLEILDNEVFGEVIQKLIFGSQGIVLTVKAEVDVELATPVGTFVVRRLPAEGEVPVKPISSSPDKGLNSLKPSIHNLEIADTSQDSISIQADADFTNPTNYSATIPYFNINILNNNTILGHAVLENTTVRPGRNCNITIKVIWEPHTAAGKTGRLVGRELISQYLSGMNTTLTFRTHNGTIPSQPTFGDALSRFPIEIPTPRLRTPRSPIDDPDERPDEPEDNAPKFITSTTLHLLSSTAIFSLISPLKKTTLYIEQLNATAFYHQSVVGTIFYEYPFAVPPGESQTPRIPVDWNLGSVGYEAVKKALGGQLHVNASADVGVRLGLWRESLWFKGQGIGAHVRL